MILKTLFCLSRWVPLVPISVEFYLFCIYLRSNNRIQHCIACPSHCMCSVSIINLYIVKWVYSRIHLLIFLYCFPCRLPSDPNTMSKHFHRFFCCLFWETYWLLVLLALFHQLHFQGRNTFHQRVSRIHWKYQYYNLIFCMLM